MSSAISATKSLCSECKALVPAEILEDDGRVVIAKHCPVHGDHRALTCSDADWYRWSRRFLKPGRIPRSAPNPFPTSRTEIRGSRWE